MKKAIYALVLAAAIIIMANCDSCNTTNTVVVNPDYTRISGGTVHGTVLVENNLNNTVELIYLTDFEVQLLDLNTNQVVSSVKTDFFGRYYFPITPIGKYRIQWPQQKGWSAGNLPADITLGNSIAYADQIKPVVVKASQLATGRVEMLSGSATFFDEVFAISSIPEVAFNNNSMNQRTDIFGQFALSISGDPKIKVKLGDSNEEAFNLDISKHTSYTFQNTSPILLGFEVAINGAKVKYPKAGEVINLRALATDPDNDDLSFQWKVRGLEKTDFDGNDLSITLPKGQGTIEALVIINDNKGGIIQGRHKIGYGQTEEVFSGVVIGSNYRLDGVAVSINNVKATTDTSGHFRITVPVSDRYTLLLKKIGYTTYGQAYQTAQRGKIYNLREMENIELSLDEPVLLQDGGARLEVPVDGLVDSDGNPPQGAVIGNFTLLDIENNEFPGDFIGRDGEETVSLISYGMVEIQFSDGEGTEYNLRKGLKAKITIPIAGQDNESILANAPATMPIWTYNEKTGEWDKSGQATLNKNTRSYEGTIEHFSTVNIDQPGAATCIRVLTDPELMSNYLRVSDVTGDGIDYATVKEVQIDDALSAIYRIPPNQKVKIDILDGPAGNIIADVFIDVYDAAQPQDGWVPKANNEILAGGPVSNIFPGYPYEECPITIHLKHQPNSNPSTAVVNYNKFLAYKGIVTQADAATYYNIVDVGGFRTTLNAWLSHNGYSVVSSSPVVYGNNTDLTNYFRTAFLNNNDLGSGRDMHFLRNADGTASSYVANYGNFDQNYDNADKAENRNFIPGTDIIATVCMEWSPLDNSVNQWIDNSGAIPVPFNKETGPTFSNGYLAKVEANSVVKFFVYVQNALNQTPARAEFANLDGYQDKYIPNLCYNCHGGTFSDPFLGVHFRELDYKSYRFSSTRDHTALTQAELNAFESQNEIVKKDNTSLISSLAVKELIDIWYGDNDNIQQVAIPDLWKKNNLTSLTFNATDHPERLYVNVVGKSCRTCHVAFDKAVGGFDLGFNQYEEFKNRKNSIGNYLTNTGYYIMPHAVITHRNFWTEADPELDETGNPLWGTIIHRPSYLRQYTDNVWGAAIQ